MHHFLILLTVMATVGCVGPGNVRVVDPDSRPLEGARVYAISASLDSAPHTTDRFGEAPLPYNIQGSQWIRVNKEGYTEVRIDVPKRWPAVVVLHPVESIRTNLDR